jgi:hypothetical protein
VRAEKDARLKMQLASQREVPDQEISPLIRAALIDSMFETAAPLFAGIVFVTIAAAIPVAQIEIDRR